MNKEEQVINDFEKMCVASINPDLYSCLVDEIIPALRQSRKQFKNCSDELLVVVTNQSKDDGLWFNPKTAPEAYLQQELQKLHIAIKNCIERKDR